MGKAKITGNMTTGFQQWTDKAILNEYKGTKTYMGGYIAALEESPEVEIVPTTFWSYGAGGTTDGEAYQKMKQDILDRLAKAMPLDAVALCLHGAGIAEGVDDAETDLTAAIRKQIGPDVKLISSLDHHCNMIDDDFRQTDLITIVYHYPHIDMYETAYRGAKLLPGMIKGDIKPYGCFERLPMIMQCFSTMDGNLYAPIRKKVEEFAKRDGIYEFSFAYGFPFADTPYNSAGVNVWAKTPELAEKTAKEAAALLASGKEEQERSSGFLPDAKNPGPIVIAEKSDNPGGGAPGDATHLLRELIRNKVQQAAVCAIRDPETAKKAMKAGVGKVIDVELGGKLSKLGGRPGTGESLCQIDQRRTLHSRFSHGRRNEVRCGARRRAADRRCGCGRDFRPHAGV